MHGFGVVVLCVYQHDFGVSVFAHASAQCAVCQWPQHVAMQMLARCRVSPVAMQALLGPIAHLVGMPGPGKGRYRGVSKPGDGSLGWVAQRRGVCYAARFDGEEEAATWLAKRLGVSKSALRWADPSRQAEPSRSFRGVVFHSGCWEARLPGGNVLGYCGSQQQALDLLLSRTRKKEKQFKKKDFSTRTLRARFRGKHRFFGSYEAGDVKTMYEHESKYAALIYAQECMHVCILYICTYMRRRCHVYAGVSAPSLVP